MIIPCSWSAWREQAPDNPEGLAFAEVTNECSYARLEVKRLRRGA